MNISKKVLLLTSIFINILASEAETVVQGDDLKKDQPTTPSKLEWRKVLEKEFNDFIDRLKLYKKCLIKCSRKELNKAQEELTKDGLRVLAIITASGLLFVGGRAAVRAVHPLSQRAKKKIKHFYQQVKNFQPFTQEVQDIKKMTTQGNKELDEIQDKINKVYDRYNKIEQGVTSISQGVREVTENVAGAPAQMESKKEGFMASLRNRVGGATQKIQDKAKGLMNTARSYIPQWNITSNVKEFWNDILVEEKKVNTLMLAYQKATNDKERNRIIKEIHAVYYKLQQYNLADMQNVIDTKGALDENLLKKSVGKISDIREKIEDCLMVNVGFCSSSKETDVMFDQLVDQSDVRKEIDGYLKELNTLSVELSVAQKSNNVAQLEAIDERIRQIRAQNYTKENLPIEVQQKVTMIHEKTDKLSMSLASALSEAAARTKEHEISDIVKTANTYIENMQQGKNAHIAKTQLQSLQQKISDLKMSTGNPDNYDRLTQIAVKIKTALDSSK